MATTLNMPHRLPMLSMPGMYPPAGPEGSIRHRPMTTSRSPVTISDVIEQLRLKLETKFGSMLNAFRKIDADHSGFLSRDEVERALLEFNLPSHHVSSLLKELDTNCDGVVSFSEFSAAMQPRAGAFSSTGSPDRFVTNRHVLTPSIAGGQMLINDNLPYARRSEFRPDAQLLALPQGGHAATATELSSYQTAVSDLIYTKYGKLRDAFRTIDANKDGRLSESELKQAIRMYNLPIPERHVQQLFTQLCGGDGQVDYEAFAVALKRKDALGN